MVEIRIDANVCAKCGSCTLACPLGFFEQEEKGTVPSISDERLDSCFLCGQCVSVCPQSAITHSHFTEDMVTAVDKDLLPSHEQVMELIHSRRSARAFKDKPVDKETLEAIIEAARYAPSGHNEQSTEFIVIQGKDKVHEIGELVAKGIERVITPFRYAIGRMIMSVMLGRRGAAYLAKIAPEMQGLVDLFKEGTDWFVRDAPLLLLFVSDSAGGSHMSINANLAVQNATLAAESLGVGSIYGGFILTANDYGGGHIAKYINLPDTHKIYGALIMGYPKLMFRKWPERKPAKVQWIGAD